MTSSQLKSELAGGHSLSFSQVSFSPEDVYRAGTLAQDIILRKLLLREATIQLALVAEQERYTFPVATVTGTVAGTPARLTLTGHVFHTGDEVYVASVGGTTGVNGIRTVTKVDANTISLDGTTGTGAWTSGGKVYHRLYSAAFIPPEGIRLISGDDSGRVLTKKTQVDVDMLRTELGEGDGGMLYFWEEVRMPAAIGIINVPAADCLAKVHAYFGALPCEALSETVDPLVPDNFEMDRLLIIGARALMYEKLALKNIKAAGDAKAASDMFGASLRLYSKSSGASHRAESNDPGEGIRW